ncbi:hypothetical protein H8L32_10195 [Undibacterium sp. CY18W]|uniref:Virulence plasmid A protein n=1 Tax=Undibacterium hunanense TaxID=2762292 RepID=A0ABR6ZQN8_9BURK|nr:DUF6493 family protein [Undibacterium hunanense]MBC3917843.1 hypothetical protein [Undibacterium hunanense]
MAQQKTEAAFVAKTALEEFVVAGNYQGMMDYLRKQDKTQWQQYRGSVMRMNKVMEKSRYTSDMSTSAWRSNVTAQQWQCLRSAIFLCCTTNDVAENSWMFFIKPEELVELWKAYSPSSTENLVANIVVRNPGSFRIIQSLLINGLAERPTHDNYLLGLLSQEVHSDRVPDVAYWIKHDPEILQGPLLQLFDIEGTTDISLAGRDKYTHNPDHTWQQLFLNLCQQGVYSRELLLDKTLGALEKDWIQFRSGWFSRFHDVLAPTVEEMSAFSERYLGLCHSRIPPTVSMALKVLGTLHAAGAISNTALLTALQPLLSSAVKAQVDAALKLLDQIILKDASLMQEAASIAVFGLLHEAADMQKKIISRLGKWGMDAATQEQALQLLPQVATSNRNALMALLGTPAADASKLSAPIHTSQALPTLQPLPSPIAENRALPIISDIDALIEACAYVFENSDDTDCFETVIHALLKLAPFSAEDKKRFAPVLKRAQKLKPSSDNWRNMDKPLARELARLLVFIFEAERLPPISSFAKGRFDVHSVICQRTDDLMDILMQAKSVLPLAAPSHQRGYIDPAILIERTREQHALGLQQPLQEQVLSLLRLAPSNDSNLRQQAASLPDTPYHNALRYALGSQVSIPAKGKDSALYITAARARYPDEDDANLIQLYGDFGPDGAHAARYRFEIEISKNEVCTFYYSHLRTTPKPRAIDQAYLSILRHPQVIEDDGYFHRTESFGGSNESKIRWSASIMPSSLEAVFAEGAHAIANNLDWWEAEWYNKAYLNLLLVPTVPMSSSAIMLLAFALAGKEPGQTAIAIDALVASWLEGRLDAVVLGNAIQGLLATPQVKASRYAQSLGKAARAHVLAPHLAFQLLCIMVTQSPQSPPKDMAMLLELLNELRLELKQDLPASTLTALNEMQIGGKGKALLKALLTGI